MADTPHELEELSPAEAAAADEAFQELVDLTQDLGLYDVPLGTAVNKDTPIVQAVPVRYDGGSMCPFCGRVPVTCHHHSGGPAT